jgi:hypothetical protein
MPIVVQHQPDFGVVGAAAANVGYGKMAEYQQERMAQERARQQQQQLQLLNMQMAQQRFQQGLAHDAGQQIYGQIGRERMALFGALQDQQQNQQQQQFLLQRTGVQRQMELEKAQQNAELQRQNWDYQFTAKQKRELEQINTDEAALDAAFNSGVVEQAEYDWSKQQLRAKRYGIEPMPQPKPQEPPKAWEEVKNTFVHVNEAGEQITGLKPGWMAWRDGDNKWHVEKGDDPQEKQAEAQLKAQEQAVQTRTKLVQSRIDIATSLMKMTRDVVDPVTQETTKVPLFNNLQDAMVQAVSALPDDVFGVQPVSAPQQPATQPPPAPIPQPPPQGNWLAEMIRGAVANTPQPQPVAGPQNIPPEVAPAPPAATPPAGQPFPQGAELAAAAADAERRLPKWLIPEVGKRPLRTTKDRGRDDIGKTSQELTKEYDEANNMYFKDVVNRGRALDYALDPNAPPILAQLAIDAVHGRNREQVHRYVTTFSQPELPPQITTSAQVRKEAANLAAKARTYGYRDLDKRKSLLKAAEERLKTAKVYEQQEATGKWWKGSQFKPGTVYGPFNIKGRQVYGIVERGNVIEVPGAGPTE